MRSVDVGTSALEQKKLIGSGLGNSSSFTGNVILGNSKKPM
jgi:hypothetical protein